MPHDLLSAQAQADQAGNQVLVAELQQAHQKLQGHAAQVEELAARERNRVARELHDSVGQTIFSITLTAQSVRLLLEREPARVPEQLDRLEEMTGSALCQLRSLIAQLHPPPGCRDPRGTSRVAPPEMYLSCLSLKEKATTRPGTDCIRRPMRAAWGLAYLGHDRPEQFTLGSCREPASPAGADRRR